MKILITGAAGFLGFHLAQHFLSAGSDVLGIDNFLSGQKENIDELSNNNRFTFIEADVCDLSPGKIAFEKVTAELKNKGVERIFHLACPASPPTYQIDPLHTLDTCYLGSRNLFEIAKQQKARILISSTSEIYGDPEIHPQPETYRGNVNTMGIRSCYDEGKRVMETLGFIYGMRGVEVRTARIFNTYGPRMSPHDGRVVTNFIRQALDGQDLTLFGTGLQTRSFCFYSDLIRGLLLLMESTITDAVNLGSHFEFSMKELADIVREELNPKLGITYHPLPQDDPKQRRPNTEKALKLLGWKPEVELRAGIRVLAEDFKRRYKKA